MESWSFRTLVFAFPHELRSNEYIKNDFSRMLNEENRSKKRQTVFLKKENRKNEKQFSKKKEKNRKK